MVKKTNKKTFLGLIIMIFAIVLLIMIALLLLYGKGNNKGNKYKMVKAFDFDASKSWNHGTRIDKIGKYYVLEYYQAGYERKYSLYDENGNDVTKSVFGVDNIKYISSYYYDDSDNYIVSTTDNKYGLYDKNLNQIIKIDNYVIEQISENYFMVGSAAAGNDNTNLENVGVYDKNGKVVIPRGYERLYQTSIYDSYNDTTKTLFYAKKNGKVGIIDQNNNVIIPFEYDKLDTPMVVKYDSVFSSDNKNYFILYKNGKYGMVNENNEVIIDFTKNNLSYNKYANVVMESFSNKVNVYDLNGVLKKEINLDDNFKVDYDAYYYKLGFGKTNCIFYDNDFLYVLNSNLEYDKYVKPAQVGYGLDVNLYLTGSSIYLKQNNDKYKIYRTNDDSLYTEEEFYLIAYDNVVNINGFILCKDKKNDRIYSNCGVIDFDGKTILDFKYNSSYLNLAKNDEIVQIEYDNKNRKYSIKKYPISGDCVATFNEYSVNDNILRVDLFDDNDVRLGSNIYDLKCNKIADDVFNYYRINDNLVLVEKSESLRHYTYEIYDVHTGEIVELDNPDGVTIVDKFYNNTIANMVITDKGIYKITD